MQAVDFAPVCTRTCRREREQGTPRRLAIRARTQAAQRARRAISARSLTAHNATRQRQARRQRRTVEATGNGVADQQRDTDPNRNDRIHRGRRCPSCPMGCQRSSGDSRISTVRYSTAATRAGDSPLLRRRTSRRSPATITGGTKCHGNCADDANTARSASRPGGRPRRHDQ